MFNSHIIHSDENLKFLLFVAFSKVGMVFNSIYEIEP